MSNSSITGICVKREQSLPRGIVLVLFVCLPSLIGCQDAAVPVRMVDSTVSESATTESATTESATTGQAGQRRDFPLGLPVLLDLGAGKCIPCKMMAPILDELGEQYAGSMEVVFIDVWKDNEAGKRYGIQSIPTQIFFDAEGKELFRHEGFISKEDILAKWKELGVDISKNSSSAATG